MFGQKKRQVIVRVQAQVPWRAHRDPETEHWVGVCDALSITASGETWDDLWEGAADAIQLLLKDLFEDGELRSFLQEAGWHLQDPLPQPTSVTPRFDVPFTLNPTESVEELLAV